ncbi:MAG TPA: DUF4450 domain-containing protein [Chitinophagaceae bacterium]|nr:DUF4450 domain-containing protein [Chitinophagaceae bacterium]HPH32838.1 DUF4450 domain-containing protein [Chitinophagaceae bacterium]HPN58949.1 DUF4450 domain-containing protein [Chitinophagaceae bacterium]
MSKSLISGLLLLCFLQLNRVAVAQPGDSLRLWHNKERKVHYLPDGKDFVCVNPHLRFNRALYGTNTAFRVEAGDLPEFALYMPGMGGNLRFALINKEKHKWLIESKEINTRYCPGSMIYEIKDPLLGEGTLTITILALSAAEGLVIRINGSQLPADLQLAWVFGGASGKKFSRDGDIGADPESSFYLKAENCKDNSYRINGNSFLLSYGTGKVLTEEERYEIQTKPESQLKGEIPANAKQLTGYFPVSSTVRLMSAANLNNIFSSADTSKATPCITGTFLPGKGDDFFMIHNSATSVYRVAADEFAEAEKARQELAGRIEVRTPDSFLNTLGGALSLAADAIWEDPSFMHGAVAWRMRLPGWRGAYTADVLGWHDRARRNFESYALSQITTPATTGVVMDTALNLARHLEKVGTQLFSEGYISRNPNGDIRAHHYDMNLVFIDQLLNHFKYTGDTAFVKKMWPLLVRHLAWETNNFDMDGDGLYDAYAAIWASDAMQYSGGGVTHSSAYNFKAFKEAAALAKLIGVDGTAYEEEADKILKAMNQQLWMKDKGWYAEYKDLLGNKLLHPAAGLWTIYHALDSKVPDPFQAYQSLRYIDNHIPRIPVIAKGWNEKGLYLYSETNWQPYTWSLNNVVTSENLHTALAYWQGNRKEEAFKLWRSAMLETMYLSAGPGNFQQLSFYDAIRGELYRDFADGIGMVSRSLVEGLFGINPNGLHNELVITPGFPQNWNEAGLTTPDIRFDFKRDGDQDLYQIRQFHTARTVKLILPAFKDRLLNVMVNGKMIKWKQVPDAVGQPLVELDLPADDSLSVSLTWTGQQPDRFIIKNQYAAGEPFSVQSKQLSKYKLFDPQRILVRAFTDKQAAGGRLSYKPGHHTLFVRTTQGAFTWWQPVDIYITPVVPVVETRPVDMNAIKDKVELGSVFNDKVTHIFKPQYKSPRPVSPTLQLPIQGIGNWAYHSVQFNVIDSGFRARAGAKNEWTSSTGMSFNTPSDTSKNNIVFTSMWDVYPDSVMIPLTGKASEVAFLMAGSTNPMQSRLVNGLIRVNYTDGSSDVLELRNPENWWPIEQDYYVDGFVFTTDAPKPIRVSLKSGTELPPNYKYTGIKGFSNFGIEGGAATVLGMTLNKNKTLRSLVLKAVANDVVIGLMGLTLIR